MATKFKDFNEFALDLMKDFQGKTAVLGGYCLGSSYIRWFYGDENCILIDNKEVFYGVKIHRTSELERLIPNPQDCVFFAFDEEYSNAFEAFTYDLPDCKVHNLPKDFGYYRYLEDEFGIDVASTIKVEDFDYTEDTATNSGASRQMGLFDTFKDLLCISRISPTIFSGKNILDVGCGKGGAMITMHHFGFANIDGIEISPMISQIATDNFEKLAYENCHVKNVSALDYDYSGYDFFYMYDPFKGELFKEVIKKIYEQAKKGAIFIYANPYMDRLVIDAGFKYLRSIDTDFFIRNVNVYIKE